MASSLINLTLVLLLLSFTSRLEAAAAMDQEDKILKALPPRFVGSLQSAIESVRSANSSLGSLPSSGPARSRGPGRSSAVHGCMDMVDLADDVLHWSLCTINKNLRCAKIGTGDRISDLKTWLSATVSLLETCLEDLDNGGYPNQLRTALSEGSSHARDLLDMVTERFPNQDQARIAKTRFPSWVPQRDRKLLQSNYINPDVVVAKDGTGKFATIGDAIEAAPEYSMRRYVILVKRGVYEEVVEIKKKKWNIMLVGEGMDATFLRWNRSVNEGFKTFHTGTIGISGLGFIACNMSFENTAGPENAQAVALRSDSDLSVYYKCGFYGYQDTLYMHSMRQFYRECTIKGTIDFIFGHGTVVVQNSDILVRKGMFHQTTNTITANGRHVADSSGFTIQSCNISPDHTLVPHLNYMATYLGRPWKNHSRTMVMETYMSDIIWPQGWYPWSGTELLETVFCGEYNNYGPGAGTAGRVNWSSFHVITDPAQASMFTAVEELLEDNNYGDVYERFCKGWYPWDGREPLESVFWGEYNNSGPGAGTAGRVNWPTFHVITDRNRARVFTVANFIQGDQWLPSTGIPYNSGLAS